MARILRGTCDHVDCKLVEATEIAKPVPHLNMHSKYDIVLLTKTFVTYVSGVYSPEMYVTTVMIHDNCYDRDYDKNVYVTTVLGCTVAT